MDQDQDSPPQPADAATKSPSPGKGEDAFELWLHRSLHQLYDSVTAEPIPPELLHLIAEDRSRRGR
jgi:hypothetical protein